MRIFEQKKISKFLKHYFGGYFNKVLVQDNCFFCFVYLINMTNSEINQLRFLLAKQNCFLSSCKKTILEKKLNIEHTDNVVIPFHFFGSIFVIKGHVNDLLPFIG